MAETDPAAVVPLDDMELLLSGFEGVQFQPGARGGGGGGGGRGR